MSGHDRTSRFSAVTFYKHASQIILFGLFVLFRKAVVKSKEFDDLVVYVAQDCTGAEYAFTVIKYTTAKSMWTPIPYLLPLSCSVHSAPTA